MSNTNQPLNIPKKPRPSDSEFVKACLSGKSSTEIAEQFGVKSGSIQSRAKKLREAGVNLPVLPRQGKRIDVVGLNSIIEERADK